MKIDNHLIYSVFFYQRCHDQPGINRPESPDLPWDGAWIAFDGLGVAGERDIYIMPMFGGEAIQLTSDPGADYQPAWRLGKD